MPKFIVYKREVWVQAVEIEAETVNEANHKVWLGEGNMLDNMLEYNHDLDSSLWTVEKD